MKGLPPPGNRKYEFSFQTDLPTCSRRILQTQRFGFPRRKLTDAFFKTATFLRSRCPMAGDITSKSSQTPKADSSTDCKIFEIASKTPIRLPMTRLVDSRESPNLVVDFSRLPTGRLRDKP